jgi:hypothetical protein
MLGWISLRRVLIFLLPLRKSQNENSDPLIKILSDDIGYSKDEMHEALKRKFLVYENVQGLPTQLSTTQLSTIEFESYLEQIRRWASMDMGIIIPDPTKVK